MNWIFNEEIQETWMQEQVELEISEIVFWLSLAMYFGQNPS